MKFFHVTKYENLESILDKGLLRKRTRENNFSKADINDRAVFSWRDLEQAEWWRNEFANIKPKIYGYDAVIIEFEVEWYRNKSEIPWFSDTTCLWDEYSDVEDYAVVWLADILPERITNIH